MAIETIIMENIESLSWFAVASIGVLTLAMRKYVPIMWKIVKDGDIDAADMGLVLAQFNTGKLAKIAKKLENLDAQDIEGFYHMGTMTDEELKSFMNAMFELAGVSRDERDTVIKLVADGKTKDMDYIFEEVDVEAVKALVVAFKQLNMTQFMTNKDATPEMKEKLYQAVKAAMSKNTSDLNALQKVLV